MKTFTKKDYIIGALAGFFAGLFLLPVLENLAITFQFRAPVLLVGIPFGFMIALWVGGMLARRVGIFYQLTKFSIAGILNASVDFGILNFLIFFTGINVGGFFSLFKAASFIVANTNSYIWNKFWTFRKESREEYRTDDRTDVMGEQVAQKRSAKEYTQFLIVSLVGLGINVGAASLVVNVIGIQFGLSLSLWANIGAVAGSVLGLGWNFVGYKLIVFKA